MVLRVFMFNLFAALRAADFLFTISRSATQSYLSGRQISINSDTLKTLFKGLPRRRDTLGKKKPFFPCSKIDITFLKLNIFCSNFEDRSGWIWNARIRGLFVRKISGGAPDKISYRRFLTLWNFLKCWDFQGVFEPNTPEMSVSGTALTILKFRGKNIEFEIHYGWTKNWKFEWKTGNLVRKSKNSEYPCHALAGDL